MSTLRTYLTLLLTIALAGTVQAQHKYEIDASQSAGYESNIFSSPSTLTTDTGKLGKQELYRNNLYTLSQAKLKLRTKIKKRSQILAKGNGELKRYPNLSAANQHRLGLDVQYRYKVNKKLTLGVLGDADLSRRLSLNQINDDQVRLLQYGHLGGGGMLLARPMKGNTLRFIAKYGRRKYKTAANETDLTFRYMSLQLYAQQNLTDEDQVAVTLTQTQRNYLNRFVAGDGELTDGAAEPLVFMDRAAKVNYKKSVDEGLRLNVYAKFMNRKDVTGAGLGYREVKVGGSSEFKWNNIGLDLNGSFYNRDYKQRLANPGGEASGTKLVYRFIQVSAVPKVYINEEWNVFAGVTFRQRLSNRTIDTVRGGRSFANHMIFAGINYRFSGENAPRRGRVRR